MHVTEDGLVEILVGPDLGQLIFPPMAWSVVNSPEDAQEAKTLFENLYNSPTSQHLMLTVHRQRKKHKVSSFANLQYTANGWGYLDTVTVLYQKPSSSSNNGFLPLAELGNLFYKGDVPDTNTTSWFNDEIGNATNFWDVDVADGIDPKEEKTHYQKFSSQLHLILMSMCRPLESRRFGYFCDVDRHELKKIHSFCQKMNVKACLYAETDSEAHKMIDQIQKD